MYRLRYSKKFKKDLKKRVNDAAFPFIELKQVTEVIVIGKSLASKYRNHKLAGDWDGFYECHISPDVLLIYRVNQKTRIVDFMRIGSHAELF